MSDTIATSPTSVPTTSGFGTFDEEGNYTPREVVVDDLGMSFADAIDGTMVEVEDGQLVNGTIVKIDKDEVLLDIGYKSEGVIPSRELSIRNDVDPHEIVTLGEKVEALVLQKEDKEGRLLLSKKRAQYERAWGTIEKLKEEDGVVEGPVIEVVKGGLIVDIGLRGFLPASLVELRRVRDLQPYVGQRISAKIIELDKNRNNVVLSRRAHLEETQKESRDQFLNNLKVGEVRHGTVSSVVSFGAFVDLGGMDGLIHVSELSWKHVDHPGSVVAVGDEVDVQVLDVDMSRERISLSLKATQQDPWQEFAGGHEVGQLVYGRVTKLVQFGAFVQVGDGIEGLVHISEMSTHHVDSPDQVVTPGEELWVKIIDLDLARRRISLSIKQAAEGGELAEEYREHFEVDEHGNWTAGDTDAEREAAWSEYYGEDGQLVEGAPRAPRALRSRVRRSRARRSRASRTLRSRPPPSRRTTTPPSDPAVKLVVLTGGIGAGKSTVTTRLAARGAVIVDADGIVRELQVPGAPLLQVARRSLRRPHHQRRRLARPRRSGGDRLQGRRVDGGAQRASSTRPCGPRSAGASTPSATRTTSSCSTRRCSTVVEGLDFDGMVVVDTPIEVAVARVVEQRGLPEDDVRARIDKQISREERVALADFVVDNGGDLPQLEAQVDALWAWIEALPAPN